jgi:hypothetical protein
MAKTRGTGLLNQALSAGQRVDPLEAGQRLGQAVMIWTGWRVSPCSGGWSSGSSAAFSEP